MLAELILDQAVAKYEEFLGVTLRPPPEQGESMLKLFYAAASIYAYPTGEAFGQDRQQAIRRHLGVMEWIQKAAANSAVGTPEDIHAKAYYQEQETNYRMFAQRVGSVFRLAEMGITDTMLSAVYYSTQLFLLSCVCERLERYAETPFADYQALPAQIRELATERLVGKVIVL